MKRGNSKCKNSLTYTQGSFKMDDSDELALCVEIPKTEKDNLDLIVA